MRHRDRIAARNLGIIRTNLDALDGFFERHADIVSWTRPRAGSVAFPRFVPQVDVDALCADIRGQTGVLLAPASQFDYPGPHFRLGFGRDPVMIGEGLKRLGAYFEEQRFCLVP